MAETDQISGTIKKVMLAGVGVVSLTAEKAHALLDELAQRGEETVEEGKFLNEELKHRRQSREADDFLDSLTPEQRKELKEKILQREEAESGSDETSCNADFGES